MSVNPLAVLEGIERGAAILRALGPLVSEVEQYLFHQGDEPKVFAELPELRSPAALERARQAAKRQVLPPPSTPPST